MFEKFTKAELIDALDELIAMDIISGTVLVGDTVVSDMIGDAINDDNTGEWDGNGFGPTNPKGGVMIEGVELHRAAMSLGNQYEQQVAKETAQYYCFIIPGREYDPDVRRQLWLNMGRMFGVSIIMGGGVFITQFRDMHEHWLNTETGELRWRRTNEMRWAEDENGKDLWVRNPDVNGNAIPNHRTLTRGKFSHPDHPDWTNEFAAELAPKIISAMEHTAKWAKIRAERKGIAPSFGPIRR